MNRMRSIFMKAALAAVVIVAAGCAQTPKYGTEQPLELPSPGHRTWAVGPAVNLSGQSEVDPLLQADILYQQLQQVHGLTVIPVNRVAEVYATLRIDHPRSEEEAALVCDILGCDGLIIPTVTIYDPFDPPKFGASLQLFRRNGYVPPPGVDVRELTRSGSGGGAPSLPKQNGFIQAVGMYDAANGSVRQEVKSYAAGRNDPVGPYGAREYLVSMDRYCGFVYHALIRQLIASPRLAQQGK